MRLYKATVTGKECLLATPVYTTREAPVPSSIPGSTVLPRLVLSSTGLLVRILACDLEVAIDKIKFVHVPRHSTPGSQLAQILR